jgi:hypothetical protein
MAGRLIEIALWKFGLSGFSSEASEMITSVLAQCPALR